MDVFDRFLLKIVWIIATAGYVASADVMFQASSEGTDCRCKCILTTKDGGPCESRLGARRTVYFVETVSGGSDCRCTCDTPPPSGCYAERNVFQPDVEDLGQIDLVALHGSISNMVSAMIKLEKAIARTKSESQHDTLRENMNKVVSNLESTNGSYSDEINVFDSNVNRTERVDIIASTQASATSRAPVVPPVKAVNATTQTKVTERHTDRVHLTDQYDRIGVVPTIHDTAPSLTTGLIADKREYTSNAVPSNKEETSTSPSRVVDRLETTKPSVKEQTFDTTSITNTSLVVNTTTSATTTTSPPPLVQPKLVFVPYRSQKTPTAKPKKSRHEEAEYDYDAFDLDVVTENTTTTRLPASISTTAQTPVSNSTTVSITTTTESDESYADHLTEYEYEYEYNDEDDGTTSTTTTTTTTSTTTHPIDPCGTLYSISRPIVKSHFGRREGAWMRDPIPSKTDPTRSRKVYIANFYYGSNLIEFDGVEGVRRLRYRNFYNLPHKWSGTGHIVYNGSFYYNRAFSTTLIKYNLQYRFVSAWTRLANVAYNTRSPLTWKGHTGVHLAADEGGLWAIFPSQDPLDPHAKGTYIVNKINPVDLRVMESYKTKIRHPVSHAFMICGILYTTDRHNSKRARVNNAFDTRTLSQRSSYLGFENLFSYAVQFSYNPNEKKIYAWDNGRQVEYRVGLIH